jgi:hypothetical protein
MVKAVVVVLPLVTVAAEDVSAAEVCVAAVSAGPVAVLFDLAGAVAVAAGVVGGAAVMVLEFQSQQGSAYMRMTKLVPMFLWSIHACQQDFNVMQALREGTSTWLCTIRARPLSAWQSEPIHVATVMCANCRSWVRRHMKWFSKHVWQKHRSERRGAQVGPSAIQS